MSTKVKYDEHDMSIVQIEGPNLFTSTAEDVSVLLVDTGDQMKCTSFSLSFQAQYFFHFEEKVLFAFHNLYHRIIGSQKSVICSSFHSMLHSNTWLEKAAKDLSRDLRDLKSTTKACKYFHAMETKGICTGSGNVRPSCKRSSMTKSALPSRSSASLPNCGRTTFRPYSVL